MKESESQRKATRKYISKQWRPSVYIAKDKQELIEKWIAAHGYKSFNEYVCVLIDKDMNSEE